MKKYFVALKYLAAGLLITLTTWILIALVVFMSLLTPEEYQYILNYLN